MKKSIIALCAITLVLISNVNAGEVVRLMSYQGIVKDSLGNPITQNNLSLRYFIYADSTGGSFLWAEVTQIDVINGEVSHLLGSISPIPDTLFTTFDTLWFEVMVDGESILPRSRLVPTPYAFRVNSIDASKGGTVTGQVFITDSATANLFSMEPTGQDGHPSLKFMVPGTVIPRLQMFASEINDDGAEISLFRGDGNRSIEIDADQNGAVINMGHLDSRTGGSLTTTVQVKASADGTTGGQILMNTVDGTNTVEINAEHQLGDEARMSLNSTLDTAVLNVHTSGRYAGYFTTDYNSSFPVAVKGVFTGGDVGDPIAMWGESWPFDGKGSGGFFRGGEHGIRATAQGGEASHDVSGVQSFAYGTGAGGDRYGVYSVAQGGDIGIGVYGFASQANVNWSSYFVSQNYMGQLAIGTDFNAASGTNDQVPTGYKLAVNGKVLCEEVEVMLSEDWPDYVFTDEYNLLSLEQIENHIEINKHLPGVPSAKEVAENGVALGTMQKLMMEKIEELTLHLIELNKKVESLADENRMLKTQLSSSKGKKE